MNMAAISPVHGFRRFGFSFLSLTCVLLLQSATGRQLKLVILIMRDGDRTPFTTYPNDPYKDHVWPEGYGQLTMIGMSQQHLLGEMLRRRYNQFLSAEYSPKEIYVRSIDVDPSIMSAQANLAGLFPPTEKQLWNRNLRWQPIPVHTVPIKDDKLLHFPLRDCNKFMRLLRETKGTKTYQDKVNAKMKLFVYMAPHVGYDLHTLLDFNNLKFWSVANILNFQKSRGLRLPSWAKPDVMRDINEILIYTLYGIFGVHRIEEKALLQGGVLLKDILEQMTKVVQNKSEAKMIMYSTNDMALIALQVALDFFKGVLPHYASCFFFELYQEPYGEYHVEMHFRNNNYDDIPTPLTLLECTQACPLKIFQRDVSHLIPDNWEEECNK